MSTARRRGEPKPAEALVDAARDFSTAAVVLHGAIADRFALSPTDLKALDVLQRVGPVSAGEMAVRTGLATASVTSLLDRLERRGFVRRLRDRQDRRRVLVKPTGKVEREMVPLFASLGKRMLARSREYDRAQMDLLRSFLSACARDMREETQRTLRPPGTPRTRK
ncbi:MAG TPA: MarR family transcriptional regulator [Polyangiaceae bacterium]|nr:MarR family transcriptional regulator [Polyangiaceae bacterium]